MQVHPIPMLEDNFAYLVVDKDSGNALAIDPVQAGKVYEYAKNLGVRISHIAATHKHWDHSGGNEDLKTLIIKETNATPAILGGDLDNCAACNYPVTDGSEIPMANGKMLIKCIHTPCHTKGSICYHVTYDGSTESHVFTGDTLFVAGCGRFFEGDANDMQKSLAKLMELPQHSKVWCGHEYTVKNLLFAKTVEPENQHVIDKLKWAEQQIKEKKHTVPSTIAEEQLTNPFVRAQLPDVQAKVNCYGSIAALSALRAMKNKF